MASTHFQNGTVVTAEWLNDVDALRYDDDGAAYVKFTPSGSGNSVSSVQKELRYFLRPEHKGAVMDGATDDSTAIQATISEGANRTILFREGTYFLSSALTWASNVHAHFDNTTFVYNGSGNVDVINLTGLSNIQWTGKLTIKSNAPGDSNQVYGISADGVTDWHVEHLHFEDMARGLEAANLTDCSFQHLSGRDLKGTLQGASDEVGAVASFNGCSRVAVDLVTGENIWKDGIYLGVSSLGGTVDNTDISIGQINVTLDPNGENSAGALHIRSGVGVTVGTVKCKNGYRGVSIQAEAADDDFSIENVSIGSVVIEDADNTAAANGFHVESLHASNRIKNLSVGSITVDGSGNAAVYIGDVDDLTIGSIIAKNALGAGTFPEGVRFENVVNGSVGRIVVNKVNNHGVRLMTCSRLYIESVIATDVGQSQHGAFDAVRINADCSGCHVEYVDAKATDSGLAHLLAVDILGDASVGTVGRVKSTNHSNATPITFNSLAFAKAEGGRLYRASIPNAGTWAQGDIVWNSAPSAGGTVGWVCTTAGTPGTWNTYGAIAS